APGASESHFALVDTKKLRLQSTITLKRAFSYDALSPDARTMYLIHYFGSNGSTYEVRAFDLVSRKLVPGAIIDPREADEDMQGSPVARRATKDGAWVFTLYATATEPFIHALDTL